MKNEVASDKLILEAIYQTEIISYIFISLHGINSTYMLGWNSFLGRKLNAKNLLLWESIKYLKCHSFSNLDLGGFNKYSNYGIYNFKKKMNGNYYKLAGEIIYFWKL